MIALSLKRSAERSGRRRMTPFRSAAAQRARLEAAKDELRALYDRPRRH